MNKYENIIEMTETLITASGFLYTFANEKKYNDFEYIVDDMNDALNSILDLLIKDGKDRTTIIQICKSIICSLNNIKVFSATRSKKIFDKIEFELKPLLQEMYLHLLFEKGNSGNKMIEDSHYKYKVKGVFGNKYIEEADKKGIYKYDLSIVVTGYNKLEYTKLCIQSILKYIPRELNYELILVNHGSNDGTKEYFESLSPTKQLDILINGGGAMAVHRIIEGKYCLFVSNDVIVTKNSISNLIKCMKSDDKIAWIVPTTPNVSNLQTIEGTYTNIDEMHHFAEKNNICNSYRWEQRVRLCNPIDLVRSSYFLSNNGILFLEAIRLKNIFLFPDDKISMFLRRKGYKMMLAKDAYCYHFGSVTMQDEIAKKNKENAKTDFYTDGRRNFLKRFGIDPWGIGFCYDPYLFNCLQFNDKEHVDVLGINCGIGSNPLKIKESIKENVHNLDVTTYNVTDEKSYINDLRGVSDLATYVDNFDCIQYVFPDIKFKYIIFESKFELYKDPMQLLSNLMQSIRRDGVIAIKTNTENIDKIKNLYPHSAQSGEWIIIKNK